MFRYETVPALELTREHVGLTVQISTPDWTIVGELKGYKNTDNVDIPLDSGFSPMDALRALQARKSVGTREIRCWLTVGPWKAEVYPAQAVVVEYPDTEALAGALVGVVLELEELPGGENAHE